MGRTILKRPTTTASSKPSVSSETISTDSKVDQLTELVMMLSKKLEISNTTPQSKGKEIQPASTSSTKPKARSKSKLRCELCNHTTHSTDNCYRILFCMICKKEDHRTSDHGSYTSSVATNFKTQNFEYASGSQQTKRHKAKPLAPCLHYGSNDHLPDDCLMYPCCEICGDPSHDTSGHEKVIQARRGIPKSTPQSSSNKCKICGSPVHSTTDHNSIVQFKKTLRTKPTRKWVHKQN